MDPETSAWAEFLGANSQLLLGFMLSSFTAVGGFLAGVAREGIAARVQARRHADTRAEATLDQLLDRRRSAYRAFLADVQMIAVRPNITNDVDRIEAWLARLADVELVGSVQTSTAALEAWTALSRSAVATDPKAAEQHRLAFAPLRFALISSMRVDLGLPPTLPPAKGPPGQTTDGVDSQPREVL